MAFSMDLNQQKAEFSYAYLRAIASVAGFTVTKPEVDHDSVDCTVQARGKVGRYSSPRLDVQLKCTAAEGPLPDPFPYRLGRKNYEDLRDGHRMSPIVLALLVVPEDLASWMEHGDDRWIGRYRCYWYSLRGWPPLPDGVESRTIHVPGSQRLTPEELKRLMIIVSQTGAVT